jgi:hypothetical protein
MRQIKNYVDTLVSIVTSLLLKGTVRLAATVNGALATAYANGQNIDGFVLVTGNRIF